MRKNLFVLGVSFLFLGMIFIAVSRVAVKPEPLKKWAKVGEAHGEETPTLNLFAQGDLTRGDRFRVYFNIALLSSSVISVDASVVINLTDPNGHTETYDIPVTSQGGKAALMEPLPEDVANYTGTYKVDAWGLFVSLRYVALQRMELKEREPQYPYGNLFFVGCAVFLGGIGASYLGVKASRHKRTSLKRHLPRHKH